MAEPFSGRMGPWAMSDEATPTRATTHGQILERLAESSRASGQAQLLARGCRPLEPLRDAPPTGLPSPEIWSPGRAHAAEIAAGSDDAHLLADLALVDSEVAGALSVLSLPVELFLALGGDDRQLPVDGRNHYGFPLYDLDPAVRLSSCTATPPDRLTLDASDRWRTDLLAELRHEGRLPAAHELHRRIAQRIAALLDLDPEWADRIVLSPSGTEAVALVTALAAGTSSRPLVNIVVGAREAGSGTLASAAGRRFQWRSPFEDGACPGDRVAGFEAYDIHVVNVDIRDLAARPRRSFDIEAEIDAHVEDALEGGAQVLVHAIDQSKTGLVQPTPAWIDRWCGHLDGRVRVVVDAAQGRLSRTEVRAHLRRGASVIMTGSKSLGGPPFSGLLVLAEDLAVSAPSLPSGFRSSVAEADLPSQFHGLPPEWEPVNLPLLARWNAALDEGERALAFPSDRRRATMSALVRAVRRELEELECAIVDPAGAGDDSIVSFRLRDGRGQLLGKAALDDLFRDLVARPGFQIGQPTELAAGGSAVMRCAVGLPTVTRLLSGDTPAGIASAQVAAALREGLIDGLSLKRGDRGRKG